MRIFKLHKWQTELNWISGLRVVLKSKCYQIGVFLAKLISLSLIFRNVFRQFSCIDCICNKWTNFHIFAGNLEWRASEEACNAPQDVILGSACLNTWPKITSLPISSNRVLIMVLFFFLKEPDRSWPQSKYWRATSHRLPLTFAPF